MILVPNWRAVLKHAHSVKLIVLAAALDVAAVVLPLLDLPGLAIPLAIGGAVASTGALVARLLVQRELTSPAEPDWESGE